MLERRQGPREGEQEVEALGGGVALGQPVHHVLEGEKGPGLDLEGQVKVDGAAAALLGVQVDLPGLAQRVGLEEVALVVDVEAMAHGMVLQVGDIAGHVDHSHWRLPGGRLVGPSILSAFLSLVFTPTALAVPWPRALGRSPPARRGTHVPRRRAVAGRL